MTDRQFFAASVSMLVIVIAALMLGGCVGVRSVGAASRAHPEAVDVQVSPQARPSLCDLGILRGSAGMRCADELKRRPMYGLV